MADTAVKKIPRPQMRGLLHSAIKRNLIMVGVSVGLAGWYMRYVYRARHMQAYVDFYKNYDIEKDFERQRKKGLFYSCDTE